MLSIRYKILLIVIPLLMVSMILLTMISLGFARNGIDKIAKEFLGYKINEIIQKPPNEVKNLKKLNLYTSPYVENIKEGIEQYSRSITKENIESFIADEITKDGKSRSSPGSRLISNEALAVPGPIFLITFL